MDTQKKIEEKPILTGYVYYSEKLKNELTDVHINIINLLAELNPSCYADIADIIIGRFWTEAQLNSKMQPLTDRIVVLEKALREIHERYQQSPHIKHICETALKTEG